MVEGEEAEENEERGTMNDEWGRKRGSDGGEG
jgi:hypothetical protein